MLKKFLKLKLFCSLLVLILIFLGWQFFVPASNATESVFLEITQNEPFEKVIPRLSDNKLIRNEILYEYLAEYSGMDRKVKAGRFRINPSWSPFRILSFLTAPENGELTLTIPEGYSIFDIDKKLTAMGLITERRFIAWTVENRVMEGTLFPDTYAVFAQNFQPADLGEKMKKNFEKKILQGLDKEFKASKLQQMEIVTMASLLEKEVKTKEDFAIVAGILWKRLDNDWPLQVDAALLYGRETETRTITDEDLSRPSQYNTYTVQGFPPTPIGNPGLATIQAALNPKESPYWFYLTDKDGKVIYAKTNEEHNENRKKYL